MSKGYRWSIAVLALAFLSFLLPGETLPQTIPFETLEIGEISYFRYDDPLFQGAELVIRDKGLWEWFWNLHTQGLLPPPPIPPVDFAKEMVIAVILGFQTSGGGSKVEIIAIEEWMGDSLVPNKKRLKSNFLRGIRVAVKESRNPGP